METKTAGGARGVLIGKETRRCTSNTRGRSLSGYNRSNVVAKVGLGNCGCVRGFLRAAVLRSKLIKLFLTVFFAG